MATRTLKHLTGAQVDSFWNDGYLILDPFLPAGELATLRAGLQTLEDWIQVNEHPDFRREAASRSDDRVAIRKINHIHRNGGGLWWELMQRAGDPRPDRGSDRCRGPLPSLEGHDEAAVRGLHQVLAPGPS